MEPSDFKLFIKLWMEDTLKRGVSTTSLPVQDVAFVVQDALKRGVSTTLRGDGALPDEVEDALKNGKKLR